MEETRAHIENYHDLIDLAGSLRDAGGALRRISGEAVSWFEGQLRAFRESLRVLENRRYDAGYELDLALERLDEAEQACLDSEEDSRDSAERAVAYARGVVRMKERALDKCRERCERAAGIISDCESELDKYRSSGGFVSPPGAGGLLERLSGSHTEAALEKMDRILDAVEDCLGFPLNRNVSSGASAPSSREERFEEGRLRVENMTIDEEYARRSPSSGLRNLSGSGNRP